MFAGSAVTASPGSECWCECCCLGGMRDTYFFRASLLVSPLSKANLHSRSVDLHCDCCDLRCAWLLNRCSAVLDRPASIKVPFANRDAAKPTATAHLLATDRRLASCHATMCGHAQASHAHREHAVDDAWHAHAPHWPLPTSCVGLFPKLSWASLTTLGHAADVFLCFSCFSCFYTPFLPHPVFFFSRPF